MGLLGEIPGQDCGGDAALGGKAAVTGGGPEGGAVREVGGGQAVGGHGYAEGLPVVHQSALKGEAVHPLSLRSPQIEGVVHTIEHVGTLSAGDGAVRLRLIGLRAAVQPLAQLGAGELHQDDGAVPGGQRGAVPQGEHRSVILPGEPGSGGSAAQGGGREKGRVGIGGPQHGLGHQIHRGALHIQGRALL